MRPLAAIILAAGKGTRMKSAKAKVLFPLAGKSMVLRVTNTALKADCEQIVIVIGHQKQAVIEELQEIPGIMFAEQNEQLGTGHAVICAAPAFENLDSDVLILAGDVPLLSAKTLSELVQTHRQSGAACTLLTAFLDDPGKYGRVLRDDKDMVHSIVEYKDASQAQRAIKEWNTGIYCFKARELFASLDLISNQNQQGEYYLTDTLEILYKQGHKIASIPLDDLTEVSGVNSQEQLAELEDALMDKIRSHWMNSGVVMHNPRSIYIEDDVILEPDVEIYPNCVITGKSLIKSGALIGPNCYVMDSVIGESCILQAYNTLSFSNLPPFREMPSKQDLHGYNAGDPAFESPDNE